MRREDWNEGKEGKERKGKERKGKEIKEQNEEKKKANLFLKKP